MSLFGDLLAYFLSLDLIFQIVIVVAAALVVVALLRFATNVALRLLSIGCAIILVLAIIWAIYAYVLNR
jgi:hypothetical protein